MPRYSLKGVAPRLGEGVYVAPNATIVGDVVIGDHSSVWFGAVLRGDIFPIRIGARTNVQDNAVVHVVGGEASTQIGDDVTIGHQALLHGCTVGSSCLIGMGSILLDGVVVEDECLIAAGSLVRPGARVPARSLVAGHPAKVVRTLGDADLEAIRAAASQYVEYGRDFAQSLAKL